MAQKSMKTLAASGDEQISDGKARSCALSSTASQGKPGRNSASPTDPATSSVQRL
jgi:hypothetical protein